MLMEKNNSPKKGFSSFGLRKNTLEIFFLLIFFFKLCVALWINNFLEKETLTNFKEKLNPYLVEKVKKKK